VDARSDHAGVDRPDHWAGHNKKDIISLACRGNRCYSKFVMELWDYKNGNRNEIHAWAKALSSRDRAALNQKLDILERIDFELAHGLKLLAGPIQKSGHVLKLRASGDTALSPLLCRGPNAPLGEYTLLQGAQIRDGQFCPKSAVEDARRNRELICAAPNQWRTVHERA